MADRLSKTEWVDAKAEPNGEISRRRKDTPAKYLQPPTSTVWVEELPDPIDESISGVFVQCPTCYALGIYKEIKRAGYAQHMRIKHGIRKKSN